MDTHSLVTSDAWQQLRRVTPARIALGRAGGSLPTREWLAFQSAHAVARDAVHAPFDAEKLAAEITVLGVETVVLGTCAADQLTFLQRPDLGRRLDERSAQLLKALPRQSTGADLAIIVSDGLSALAANRQSVPLLSQLLPRLQSEHWNLAPIAVVRFCRVALEDQVGQLVGAEMALMFLGERPGLGSPDSLGAYLVHSPGPGNTDANRNCVSNIRPEGLASSAAADTIYYLLTEARRRRLSGVRLKDERISDPSKTLAQRDNNSHVAYEK